MGRTRAPAMPVGTRRQTGNRARFAGTSARRAIAHVPSRRAGIPTRTSRPSMTLSLPPSRSRPSASSGRDSVGTTALWPASAANRTATASSSSARVRGGSRTGRGLESAGELKDHVAALQAPAFPPCTQARPRVPRSARVGASSAWPPLRDRDHVPRRRTFLLLDVCLNDFDAAPRPVTNRIGKRAAQFVPARTQARVLLRAKHPPAVDDIRHGLARSKAGDGVCGTARSG